MARQLQRQVSVPGAVVIGLGSILGTGVFVIGGLGYSQTGLAVFGAILVGAFVAYCNGMNSAQLAANYPVSGGTYEYGYRLLNPRAGFTAGWMFLLAKSASAATACTVLAQTLMPQGPFFGLGALIALGVMVAVLLRLRRTQMVNTSLVATAVLVIGILGVYGLIQMPADPVAPVASFTLPGFLETCALIFVGYTGYGRVATLGEEIIHPRRNIPRAILATLLASLILYLLATVFAVYSGRAFGQPEWQKVAELPLWLRMVGGVGLFAALLGVVLNLILGLSRMLLAMARRGDMPALFATLDKHQQPAASVLAVGFFIALLTLVGGVEATWAFSAFTVLIYYAICNAAALRIPDEIRLYGRWLGIVGLLACLFLAFWVDWRAWALGLLMLGAGLIWHQTRHPDRRG